MANWCHYINRYFQSLTSLFEMSFGIWKAFHFVICVMGCYSFRSHYWSNPLTGCQQEVAPKPLNNENFKKSWIPNTLFRCRRILKVTPDIQSQAAKLAFSTSARSRKCVIKTQIYALMFFSNSDAVFLCRKSIFALHNTARGSQKGLKRGLGTVFFLVLH